MSEKRIPQDCQTILEDLDMVRWDRFTVGEMPAIGKVFDVYGWIERDGDSYKDFVHIQFYTEHPDFDDVVISCTTSSDEWTEEITRRIFGDVDGHNDCKRVEHHTDVPNVVELGEQTTLPVGESQ